MENNFVENEKSIPLARLIYKNLVLIIMIVVLTSLIGFAYAIINVKPTYTVNRSFILKTTQLKANDNGQASLGKLFIPFIKDLVVLPEFIQETNDVYTEKQNGQTKIRPNSLAINYKDESLIFTISYTDANIHDAAAKIHAIYLVASEKLAKYMNIESVKLIDIDNVNIDVQKDIYEGMSYTTNGGYTKYILLGACVGLVISMCIVLIMYALDNTIHSKEELEQLTGASVLAFISKNK